MPFKSDLCDHVWAPFATSVTTTTVSAILSIITVPGNLLICWAVIWNPTRNLRSPFNYLVLNLAVANLIVGAVTEPVFFGFHLTEALKHSPVQGVRWIVYMSYFMSSTASVLSMVALAINRYQLTTQNRIQRYKTSSTVISSLLLWTFSFGLPMLYIAVGFYLLAFIFANTAVIISIVVLLFIYFRIYQRLQQHEKNMEHIRSKSEQQKRVKQEEKLTISFLLIIISFLACAIPSLVMIYVINLCHTCSCVLIHWFRDLQYLFLLANSASNQFLYAWRMRSFRKAFQTIRAIQWVAKTFGGRQVNETCPQLLNGQNGQIMGWSPSRNAERHWISHYFKGAKIGIGNGSQTDSMVLSDGEVQDKNSQGRPKVCAWTENAWTRTDDAEL